MGGSGDEGLPRGRPPSTLGSQGLLKAYSVGCSLRHPGEASTFPSSQPGYTKHVSCWALYWALDSVLQPGPSRGSLPRDREYEADHWKGDRGERG